jgi:hypothetical protein
MKKTKIMQIPKNMNRGKRNKISLVLIEELQKWKSTTKVTTDEFCLLVERLYKIIK